MQIRVTKSDDFSWHRWHVGETFTVNRTITHTGGGKSYEVDLIDRHPDSFAGLISADDCEVVDWTDAPPSMEIERLRSQLATLTAERDEFERQVLALEPWREQYGELRAQVAEKDAEIERFKARISDASNQMLEAAEVVVQLQQALKQVAGDRDAWKAERDDLAAKLASQEALVSLAHDLVTQHQEQIVELRQRVAVTWQPVDQLAFDEKSVHVLDGGVVILIKSEDESIDTALKFPANLRICRRVDDC